MKYVKGMKLKPNNPGSCNIEITHVWEEEGDYEVIYYTLEGSPQGKCTEEFLDSDYTIIYPTN